MSRYPSRTGTGAQALVEFVQHLRSAVSGIASSLTEESARAKAAEAACLPLAGGEMSGTILAPQNALARKSDTGALVLKGSSPDCATGAKLVLHGDNANKGAFSLRAVNGDAEARLAGWSDGRLVWNATDISGAVSTFAPAAASCCTKSSTTACKKIGRLCMLVVALDITTACSGGETLLTGLPPALVKSPFVLGRHGGGTSYGAYVNTDGTVSCFGSIPVTLWLFGSITYVTAS